MRTTLILLLLATIVFHTAALSEQQKAKETSRSRRSLSSKIQIYTLDNFIALVDKIERHEPTKKRDLKVIANYIRKLGYDNNKWNLLLGKQTESLPDGALTSQEKSVLVKMIKHRFLRQQEEGVVHTPYGDVAMGRVITGICAGASRNKAMFVQQLYKITSKHIDNLYAATIAGDLGLTGLENAVNPSAPVFGPGGTWSPNTQCPYTFNLENRTPSKATNAQILGGIDGFLMGLTLSQQNAYGGRLSQLLRMYYHGGVNNLKRYDACKRLKTFKEMATEKELREQVTASAYAEKAAWNKNKFNAVKYGDIPQLSKRTTQQFYSFINNLPSTGKSCPTIHKKGCLLPANIVFVLDESGSITSPNYEVEKNFVKNIIDAFDMFSDKTRFAVVEFSDDAHETIRLDDYYSKSTLMCAVQDLPYGDGGTETSKALRVAHNILKNAQANAGPKQKHIPQVMVLLTDGKSNGGETVLRPIVREIKKSMTGLTIIAVGIGGYKLSELQLMATDPTKHVFTAKDFSRLISLVKSLRNDTCKTSTVVDPLRNGDKNANSGQPGKGVEVTGYINVQNPRYFTIPAKGLHKSENISIQIKPTYGTVTLYGSRTNASPGPDNHDFKYTYQATGTILRQRRSIDAASGNTLEFWNICKGYNATNCPPLYLSIHGENSTNSCYDLDCSVPDQIKFELKIAQIIKKQENVCYLALSAARLINAANVSIKVLPINDSITLLTSRTYRTPNLTNNDNKLIAKEIGRGKLLVISEPCEGYSKVSQCLPIYMSIRGSNIICRNCTAGGACDNLPRQITIALVYVQPTKKVQSPATVRPQIDTKKLCFYQLSPDSLSSEVRNVEIKVSALNGTVEMSISRRNSRPDDLSHTGEIHSLGNSTVLRIDEPCSGYDKDSCPPLYLSFKGNQLSCNCTTDVTTGQPNCTLPQDVTITLTKGSGQPSKAAQIMGSIVLAIISVLLSLVS